MFNRVAHMNSLVNYYVLEFKYKVQVSIHVHVRVAHMHVHMYTTRASVCKLYIQCLCLYSTPLLNVNQVMSLSKHYKHVYICI